MKSIKLVFLMAIVALIFSACATNMQKFGVENPRELSYIDSENKSECKVFFDYGVDNLCDFEKRAIAQRYRTIWDGECKDGYADGLGAEISIYGDVYIAVYKDKIPHYIYEKRSGEDAFFIGEFGNIYDSKQFDERYGLTINKETYGDEAIFTPTLTFTISNDELKKASQAKNAKEAQDKLNQKTALRAIESYKKSLAILQDYKEKICNTDCTTKNGCIYYYIEENAFGGEDFDYFRFCKKGQYKIIFNDEMESIKDALGDK